MPHQCTTCDLTFEDGSKQMLGGCPECGGNKFQFLPEEEATRSGTAPEATPTQRGTSAGAPGHEPFGSVAEGSGRESRSEADIIEAPTEPVDENADQSPDQDPEVEDRAQASARTAVVSEDELPRVEATYASEALPAPADEADRPDIAQLREELNEQFESIKILRPGEYELNLMELYDREEYIIALEEDGRYVIDVPDTWRDED